MNRNKVMINFRHEHHPGTVPYMLDTIKFYGSQSGIDLPSIECDQKIFICDIGGRTRVSIFGPSITLVDEFANFLMTLDKGRSKMDVQKVLIDIASLYTVMFREMGAKYLEISGDNLKDGVNLIFEADPGDTKRYMLCLRLST